MFLKMKKEQIDTKKKKKKDSCNVFCLDMSRELLRADEAKAGAELLAEELLEGVSLVLELFSSTSQPSPRFKFFFLTPFLCVCVRIKKLRSHFK